MLGDLDRTLAAFLGGLLPDGTGIGFDPPVSSWVQEPPEAPLLAAHLFDIRENPQPPVAEAVLARDDAGRPLGWQLPVRHFRVSYLLTAWTADGPASQHDLLGAVLVGCTTLDSIPPEYLQGALATQAHPVVLTCAPADPAPASAELWAALRIPARTSLELLVVLPVVPPLITELAPPVEDRKLATRSTANPAGPRD